MPTLCINCTEIIDEKIEIEIHMLKEKKLSMISLKINPEPDRNPKWTLKQAQPLLILHPGGFQQHWMHPGPAKNYHRLLPHPPPRLLIELGWRAAWALGFTSKFSRQLSHAAKLRDHHLPPGWVGHPLCRPVRHWLTTTARQMCAAALLSTLASKGHTPVCQKTGDLWYLHLL